ncbi:hypothetical protein ACFL2V_15160 [Pseudomonadota bacterium]
MNEKIIQLAFKKFEKLSKKYDGFINVFLDDWRGYRLIYDVEVSSCCKYGCEKCPLYQLLKDEKEGLLSAGLYLASNEDKVLFGPQKFLNCKSFEQYQDCFVNFLVEKCNTKEEIIREMELVKNVRVIFSRNCLLKKQEIKFKSGIVTKALILTDHRERKIIKSAG